MNDDFDFGLLNPWIKDDQITDINYNGKQVWVDHLQKGRYPIEPFSAHDFMQALAYKIANYVNLPFNISSPILEAETKELRISMIHQSVCRSGLSISIRKTPALLRITDLMMKTYAPMWVIDLLKRAVKSRANILISGLPGSGKTELVKYLMKNIPASQRVITIEDSLELRYGEIHPLKDHVMIKVSELFDYEAAIKAALRQRPDWICVSEVRGREVMQLIQSCSTGASVLSTVHAENAHSIPQRLLHMMPDVDVTNPTLLALVHSTIDLGVHLEIQSSSKGIKRKIKEIVYYYLDENFKSKSLLIYSDEEKGSELHYEDLPKKGIHHEG
jgi:pilus assembly protein CpaF